MKSSTTYFFQTVCILLIFVICNNNELKAQQLSSNGHSYPVNTNGTSIRVMMAFVELLGPCAPNDQTNWTSGNLPINVDDFFDPSFTTTPNPNAYISRYFWESSFGKLKVEGDYINSVIQIPCSGNHIANVLDEIDTRLDNGILNFGTYSSVADFDHYTIADPSGNIAPFITKPAAINNRIDVLMIFFRNNPSQPCSPGGGSGGACIYGTYPLNTIGTSGIDVSCAFGMCSDLNSIQFVIQEFFHGMFGDNDWHLGDGAGYHTVPFKSNPWGIATQSNGAGVSNVVSGWDRDFCGWHGWSDLNQTVLKSDLIMAKDLSNNDINSDFSLSDYILYPNGIDFVLRDFVTYGDAFRLKMPYIDCLALGDTKNQYIWLENHQNINYFDHSLWEGNICKEPWVPGVNCYMQIGKDIKDDTSPFLLNAGQGSAQEEPNTLASWLLPITAEGNFDYHYETPVLDVNDSACIWNHWSTPINNYSPNTLPNPFTGFSELFNYHNTDNDGFLNKASDYSQPGYSEFDANSNLIYNVHSRGDTKDGFSLTNKSKFYIASNPAPVPIYSYKSGFGLNFNFDVSQPTKSFENRTIWLNGISFEILDENYLPGIYGQGAIKAHLKFDDYLVDQNVRWCGEIKLSPHIFNSSLPSLIVDEYKEVLLDRGKSATHLFSQGVDGNGNHLFTIPTHFIAQENSIIELKPNSIFTVANGSVLELNTDSKIIVGKSAKLIVKSGSKMVMNENSTAIVDGGIIIIEQGGELEYRGATIELVSVTSILEITGLLSIKDIVSGPSIFTFTGDGFIRFNSQMFPSTNITAENNCQFLLANTNQNKKVMEIVQETVYIPKTITNFEIILGKVVLWPDSRLQCDGLNTIIKIDNTLLTSNTGMFNGHRGLFLFGQPNVIINHSTFEYGKFGIYAFLTYGGSPLSIDGSIFRNGKYGLYSYDKGIYLRNCAFTNNSKFGWYGYRMSFPSTSDNGYCTLNDEGYFYEGDATASLSVHNPWISENSTGIRGIGTTIRVDCGLVSRNTQYGFNMGYNSILDMQGNATFSPQVTAIDNGTTIGLNIARRIELIGGYNELQPLSGGGTFSAVNGTVRAGVNCNPFPLGLNVSNNHWNLNNNFTSNDYLVNTNVNTTYCPSPSFQQPVTLFDSSPIIATPCGQAIPCPGCRVESPMADCPTCEYITTPSYTNKILNEAAVEAAERVKQIDGTELVESLALFAEVLLYDISSPDASEKYIQKVSLEKMLEVYGDAFQKGQLTEIDNIQNLSAEVLQVCSVLDTYIGRAITSNDYAEKLYLTFNKAQVYRVAGRRDMSIDVLNTMYNWIELVDQEYLDKIICLTNLEIGILNGSLPLNEVDILMETCNGVAYRVSSSNTNISDSKNLDNKLIVVPNPSSYTMQIEGNHDGIFTIEMINVSGQKIYTKLISTSEIIDISNLSPGLYYIIFRESNGDINNKIKFVKQ